ncbi:MAG TPA: hypothetical protein VHI52_19715, partial [Verrucomicrobiae bacterium]|nr:hypothetical protein [Verrucomicrobiae bacterium]
LLAWCGSITVITTVSVIKARTSFPAWFAPVFLGGVACFLGMLLFQIRAVAHACESVPLREGADEKWLWGLSIVSVLCTSSLHGFAPFRLDVLRNWSQLPSFLRVIRFNLVFTATLLAGVITLAVGYFCGQRRLASAGLVVLADLMLVPNDDCPNAFNGPWIAWLGASPMMFSCNSAVLLIGYCGLQGSTPGGAMRMMGLINAGILLLGLGHITHIVW